MGRVPAVIELTDAKERDLRQVLKTPSAPQEQAMRARIVLRATEGASNTEVAGGGRTSSRSRHWPFSAAWLERYDSGEWDDPPGKLALLYDIERVDALVRDGGDPFHPDRDRPQFARFLIDSGCQPPLGR